MDASNVIATQYKDQLPKNIRASWPEIFNYTAGLASILSLIQGAVAGKTATEGIPYISMAILIATLMIHSYMRERKKLHRYAQAVYFYHYANHIVRDYLAQLKAEKLNSKPEHVLQDLTDSIAQCFSIITGKRCRSSVKELFKEESADNFQIKTVSRDKIGEKISNKRAVSVVHTLSGNTDFYNLWYSIEGCSRYYIENDIPGIWKHRKYENTSFKETGEPEIKNFAGLTVITRWPLPYKSTIVFPIRYVGRFEPPEVGTNEEKSNWRYRGFLCVDCNSRNVFESTLMPELGTGFADLLYIMLDQSAFVVDMRETSKSKGGGPPVSPA
ncbi:MAG: hypothetical protein HQL64_16780 [Magnetococcales bacterium]|nr:hypothetical protein [Magnetococcales bacterium]